LEASNLIFSILLFQESMSEVYPLLGYNEKILKKLTTSFLFIFYIKSDVMKINWKKGGEEMAAKSLKVGWVIMLIFGMYRIMESVILVAIRSRFNEIMRIVSHAFSGTGVNPPIAIHHSVFSLILCCSFSLAATGVAIIIITLSSYRKAERWSWWCLLLLGGLPLFGITLLYGFDPITKGSWILFVLAIAIPARAILSKKVEYNH